MNEGKEYTTWRRCLAWFGFVNLFIWAAVIIAAVVWANHYIDASLIINQ